MNTRWIIGTSVVFLLTACVQQPQTREEFRTVVTKGAFSAKAENFVVNKSFKQAIPNLTTKTESCLNKVVERSMTQGMYHERSQSTYRANVVRPTANRAEFTMQVKHNPRGVGADPPPGGYYLIVADIEEASPSSIKVNLYRPTMGHGDTVDAIRNWLQGKDDACPKLP